METISLVDLRFWRFLVNWTPKFSPAVIPKYRRCCRLFCAIDFCQVYTFGPTFRAENSNTVNQALFPSTSHCLLCSRVTWLNSGWLNRKWRFAKWTAWWTLPRPTCDTRFNTCCTLFDTTVATSRRVVCRRECLLDVEYLTHGAKADADGNRLFDGSASLLASLHTLVDTPFARCSYTKGIELLKAAGREFSVPIEWGMDLPTDCERYLAEEVYKGPVFVYDYPKDIKSFYMRMNDDNKTVAAFDLLVPGEMQLFGSSCLWGVCWLAINLWRTVELCTTRQFFNTIA